MEFLSSEFVPENKTFPVNLVLQSVQSVQAGFNAAGTGNYIVANLPFDPTDGFHEYRIDFVPGNVIFYADGLILAKMNTSAVPTMPGHLIITQWSNGNPLWSSGPPPTEALIAVSYVKPYFNSSDPARQSDFSLRCTDQNAAGAVCPIPDQIGSPDFTISNTSTAANMTNGTYFFSNENNMTANQTVYHKSGVAKIKEWNAWSRTILSMFLLSLFVVVLL